MTKTREAERPLLRCSWARSELMIRYHDEEWGVPVHDDRTLFEFLILEGAQAGLSWETILNKREHYRTAFDGFDPNLVVRYDRRKVQQLLRNPGIVRNRLKIASTVTKCQGVPTSAGRIRQFRPIRLEICGGQAACKFVEIARPNSSPYRRVRCTEQG